MDEDLDQDQRVIMIPNDIHLYSPFYLLDPMNLVCEFV